MTLDGRCIAILSMGSVMRADVASLLQIGSFFRLSYPGITGQLLLHIERRGSDERVAGCGRPSGGTICVLSHLVREACRDGSERHAVTAPRGMP